MTDNTYPSFDYLNGLTTVYIKYFLQPYHDYLTGVDSMESLIIWFRQVDPEYSEKIIDEFGGKSLEEAKVEILRHLALNLHVEDENTPWDLNEKAMKNFGVEGKTLPIDITNGSDTFQHELTEETTYAILVALDGNTDFVVSFRGYILSRQDLDRFYVKVNDQKVVEKYVVNHGDETIAFSTIDFIQGIVMAAEWINRDPHVIISNLRYIDDNSNITPLKYEIQDI